MPKRATDKDNIIKKHRFGDTQFIMKLRCKRWGAPAEAAHSSMGCGGARPLTLLNSRSLIICAMSPWMTSVVVLQASFVALPSLSSVRFSCGSAPATRNPPRPADAGTNKLQRASRRDLLRCSRASKTWSHFWLYEFKWKFDKDMAFDKHIGFLLYRKNVHCRIENETAERC